jgi:Asp-tRNA(Asn)/Glu-tRNA(Gln) amidotransferase B subunit
MAWEVVIGLETHAKRRDGVEDFPASTTFGAPPNAGIGVDIALPGVLPVSIAGVGRRSASAWRVDGAIDGRSVFARRTASPDCREGYQIWPRNSRRRAAR